MNIYHGMLHGIGYLRNQSKFNTKSDNLLSRKDITGYNFARFIGPQPYVCYAPFNNLFFDVRGKVLVCNQNRSFELGDIQKNTIQEIWQGENRKTLQQYFEKNDLSKGCFKCADAIKSKNYNGLPALSYDTTAKRNSEFPTRMEFEISNTCNLACTFCNSYFSTAYSKHYEGKNACHFEYPDDFVDQLLPFIPHLEYTKFSGGEPLLIKPYFDLWEKIISINPQCGIHIQTNGTVLNQRIKSMLEKGKFYIGVSLDSARKESFEQIRTFAKFDQVMENLAYFMTYCKSKNTTLNIPFTPTRLTRFEVHEFVTLANKFEATAFFNVLWGPVGQAIWTLPSDELKSLVEFYEPMKLSSGSFTEYKNVKQFEFFKNQLKQWYKNAIEREKQLPIYATYSNEAMIELLISRLMEFNKGQVNDWFTDEKIMFPEEVYKQKFYRMLQNNEIEGRSLLMNFCTYDTEIIDVETRSYFHLYYKS